MSAPSAVAAPGADPRDQELSEAREQLAATSEILRVIASSPTDVQPVFDMIAKSAARLCHAQFCFVYRFDGSLLHFMAHHGLPPEAVEAARGAFPIPPSRKSAGGRAVLSGAVAEIPDLHSDPEYSLGAVLGLNSRGTVAVPMLRDGVPIGAIALDRAEAGHFPGRQIDLVRTFADQAVIAIENVRLFDEAQAKTRDLEEALQQQTATAEVLKVISRSAFDLQAVLDTLAESAVRVCRADKGGIVRHLDGSMRYVATSGYSPDTRSHLLANPPVPGRGRRCSGSATRLTRR